MTINLFISAGRAMIAAEEFLERSTQFTRDLTYRISHATLRDEDGSTNQGFKVAIVTKAYNEHYLWL